MPHIAFWRTNVSTLFDVRARCTMSHVILNGGVTKEMSLTMSLREGFPLSPLLFAIATYLILKIACGNS